MRAGFKGVNKQLGGMRDAIIYLADQFPGSLPGTESHVTRGVKKRMAQSPTSQQL